MEVCRYEIWRRVRARRAGRSNKGFARRPQEFLGWEVGDMRYGGMRYGGMRSGGMEAMREFPGWEVERERGWEECEWGSVRGAGWEEGEWG